MFEGIVDEIFAALVVAALAYIYQFIGFWGMTSPRQFWRGWNAENRGVKLEECPYQGGTRAKAWKAGWIRSREMEPGRKE